MTCQQCHERPAQYHLHSVVDGQTVQELHLCDRCASERGVIPQAGLEPHQGGESPVSLQGWLASLLAGLGESVPGAAPGTGKPAAALRCPRCGLTYVEFSRTGLLGCPDCYDAFSEQLAPVIRRIHGKSRHEGKVPARAGGAILRRRELSTMRRELETAVSQQAFERAAELRDRIRALEAAGAGAAGEMSARPESGTAGRPKAGG